MSINQVEFKKKYIVSTKQIKLNKAKDIQQKNKTYKHQRI